MSGENDLLQRFKLEVLDQWPEACLPVNLSEEWRETLSQVIERYLDDDDDSQFSLVVGALLRILFGKNPGAEVSVPLDTMCSSTCSHIGWSWPLRRSAEKQR